MFEAVRCLFGAHVPDPQRNHWDRGHFSTRCLHCGCAMVRPPGLPWRAGRGD